MSPDEVMARAAAALSLSKVFLRLLLGFFLFFHIIYMAFLFNNLTNVELANAVQNECGNSPMERETRRYQIFRHFNFADNSLWESALNFGWVLLILVLVIAGVFYTQGKIVWSFKLTVISTVAIVFIAINLYILKTRFEFHLSNLFRSLSLTRPEKPCAGTGLSLFDMSTASSGAKSGGRRADATFRTQTLSVATLYRDLRNKMRNAVECVPLKNGKSSQTCPFILSKWLRKSLLRRIVATEKDYLSPAEAEVKLNKLFHDRDYYQLMSYLKLGEGEKDLKDFHVTQHELQDLTFADPYEAIKERLMKLIVVSYVPIAIVTYVLVLHPTFSSYVLARPK